METPIKEINCGSFYMLSEITKKLKITEDLEKVFNKLEIEIILRCAYISVLNKKFSLYKDYLNFEEEMDLDKTEIDNMVKLELFFQHLENWKNKNFDIFIENQTKRKDKSQKWLYDINTIASTIEEENFDKIENFDKTNFKYITPTSRYAILFNRNEKLPMNYKNLLFKFDDVDTVKNIFKNLTDCKEYNFISNDEIFCKSYNLKKFFQEKINFILMLNLYKDEYKEYLKQEIDNLKSEKNYIKEHSIYGKVIKIKACEFIPRSKKTFYLYLYYSEDKALKSIEHFEYKLHSLEDEIQLFYSNKELRKSYDKFFHITGKRKFKAARNEESIYNEKRYMGCFGFISNKELNPKIILELYRNKNFTQRFFSKLSEKYSTTSIYENKLNKKNLKTKNFIHFISFLIVSYIRKKIVESGFSTSYYTDLLYEINKIKKFVDNNNNVYYSNISEKQKEAFKILNIPLK